MMLFKGYTLYGDKKGMLYTFTSVGRLGNITKIIEFSKLELPNYYNVSFGDRHSKSGKMDDTCISNNGDHWRVLATVANAIAVFCSTHPNATINIKGLDNNRTRLYRMFIAKNYSLLEHEFSIYGLRNGRWEKFTPNNWYQALLIQNIIKFAP